MVATFPAVPLNPHAVAGVAPPRRILVRGVNWLGDAVMTTPALLRLRERWPEARITLLTAAKLADLWPHHPAVDEVLAFAPGESPWRLGRRLRAGASTWACCSRIIRVPRWSSGWAGAPAGRLRRQMAAGAAHRGRGSVPGVGADAETYSGGNPWPVGRPEPREPFRDRDSPDRTPDPSVSAPRRAGGGQRRAGGAAPVPFGRGTRARPFGDSRPPAARPVRAGARHAGWA